MAADLSFIWDTNIAEVSRQIDRELARIRQSVTRAGQGSGSAEFAANFGSGLEGRIKRITTDLRSQMLAASKQLETDLRRLGPGGNAGGLDLQSRVLGGKAGDPKNVFEQVNKRFEALARDIDRAVVGTPLEGQREVLQEQLRTASTAVVRELRQVYATIAQDLAKLRGEVDVAGTRLRTQLPASLEGRARSAARLPGQVGAVDPLADDRALRSVLRESDLSEPEIEREIASRRLLIQSNERLAALQERLAAELAANRQQGVVGGVAQTRGARVLSATGPLGSERVVLGAPQPGPTRTGAAYQPQYVPDEEGFLVPRPRSTNPAQEQAVQDEIEKQLRAEEFRRQQVTETVDESVRTSAAEQRMLAARRQAAEELAAQIRADQGLVGGAARAGRYGRNRQGELFEFVGDGQGGKVPQPVTDPVKRLEAEQALHRYDARIAREKEKELRAQQQIAAATQQRSKSTGGRLLDRAFGGDGHGREGRGLRLDDILTTGLSFSRYLISAAAFAAVFTALNEVKVAILDYEDSLTDLEIALGGADRAQGSFTDELSGISRFTGENPGAALDSAARGIRAFTDATDSFDTKQEFGTDFADAATELAVITNKSLSDASGDIIAITNVFEASFTRINDAIAAAKQSTGADPAQIAQGMAAIGVAAKEAGFSVEETAESVAAVQARTDQTGRSVATRLSRAFSVARGSAGQAAIRQLNSQLDFEDQINQSASLRVQLEQLARVFPTLDQAQQGYIANSVGGAANSREFLTLLTDFDVILGNTAESYDKAGEAAAEFNRKAEDLRGEVNQILGSLKNIVVQLSEAGLFDIFGAAIETLEPLLNAVDQILQLYNKMPRVLRTIIALTLEAAAAQALYAAYKKRTALAATEEAVAETAVAGARTSSAAAGGVAFSAGNAANLVALNRGAAGFRSVSLGGATGLGRQGLQLGTTLATGMATGIRNTLTRTVNFLASPAGLAILGFGGLFTAIQAYGRSRELGDLLSERTPAGGFGNIRDEINAREEYAQALRDQAGGIIGTLVDFVGYGGGGRTQAEIADFQTENLKAAADAIEEARVNATRAGADADVIDPTTPGGVADGLKALEDSGRTATQQLDALYASLQNLAAASNEADTALKGGRQTEFFSQVGARILDELALTEQLGKDQGGFFGRPFKKVLANIPAIKGLTEDEFADKGFGEYVFAEQLEEAREAGRLDPDRLNQITQDFLQETGGVFGPEEKKRLEDILTEALVGSFDTDDLNAEELEALRRAVRAGLIGTLDEVGEVVDEAALVNETVQGILSKVPAVADEARALASLRGDPRGGDLAGAQTLLEELRRGRREAAALPGATPEQLAQIDQEILEAELALQESRRERIASTAQLARSELADSLDLERLQSEIEEVEAQLDIATDATEREALNARLNELERQAVDVSLARAQAARAASFDPRDRGAQLREAVRAAQEAVDLFVARGDEVSAGYYEGVAQLRQEQQALVDYELERAAAQRSAALDPRDQIGAARAELANALDALNNSLYGEPEYYDNLTAVKEAQRSLADLELERSAAVRDIDVDPRSSLEKARNSLEDVREKLASQLPGSIEYLTTLSELQQEQIAYSDALIEAASFARQVAIDLTDPVATAREELITARQKLAAAIRQGAPEDVLNRLRIEEQNAQAAAEAAAFQQRFQDARTARDLGRISHAEYLAYLNEEAARLRAIQDRTRQQQEQLNQVEQAIKAANDALQGQFNLGDIKVPTPFEARRGVQTQFAGTAAAASIDNSTTTIFVNGADTAMVQRMLEEAVGKKAVRRYAGTSTGRK